MASLTELLIWIRGERSKRAETDLTVGEGNDFKYGEAVGRFKTFIEIEQELIARIEGERRREREDDED